MKPDTSFLDHPKFAPLPKEAKVTDHALLRYLERALGIDVPGIRQQLADRLAPAAQLGARHVRLDDGLVYILNRSSHIVTVHHGDRKLR